MSAIVTGVMILSATTVMADSEHFVLSAGNVALKGTLAGAQKNETVSFCAVKILNKSGFF